MATFPANINAFTRGEWAPELQGRADLDGYTLACRKLENVLVPHTGSGSRRPGFQHLGACASASARPELIPFDFNGTPDQAYMLELGNLVMRFWYDGGLIEDPASPGNPYTKATPWGTAELPDVRWVQRGDVMYLAHVEHPPQKLTRSAHASWTLEAAPLEDGPYLREDPSLGIVLTPGARTGTGVALAASSALFESGHAGAPFRLGYDDPDGDLKWGWGKIKTVTSGTAATIDIEEPFGAEVIEDPEFDQGIGGWADKSSDTSVSFIGYDAANKRLTLTQGASSFARAEYKADVSTGKSYSVQIVVDAVPNHLRLYATTAEDGGGSTVLATKDITAPGAYAYSITPTKTPIYFTLDTNGATSGDVDAVTAFRVGYTNLATSHWREGAFSDKRGYPSVVWLYEERLYLGAPAENPNAHFLSKAGQWENFGPGDLADDALEHYVTGGGLGAILWVADSEDLLLGANAAEMRYSGGDSGLSAEEPPQSRRQSSIGSAARTIAQVGNQIIFVGRSAKRVHALGFDLAQSRYTAPELTMLARHVAAEGVRRMAWQQNPGGLLWCCMDDGSLASCTYLPEQNVVAWVRHPMDNGAVESLAVIPGIVGDDLYAAIRRTINGSTVRYMERLAQAQDFTKKTSAAGAVLLDCCLVYSGAAKAAFTGLTHLANTAVHVLADGAVKLGLTVAADGSLTLPAAASEVCIGLPYTSIIQPMKLKPQRTTSSPSTGNKKRVVSVDAEFLATAGAEIAGGDTDGTFEMVLSTSIAAPALKSGMVNKLVSSSYSTEGLVTIRQQYPLPMTVTSIAPNVELPA